MEAETDFRTAVHRRCASDVALYAKQGTSIRIRMEGEARAQTRSGESGPECLKNWKQIILEGTQQGRGKGPRQGVEEEAVQGHGCGETEQG